MRLTERNTELVPETTTTTVLRPFFGDHPGEPVPEEKVLDFMVQGKLTEANAATIRLGDTPSGLTSAYLHHPPFSQAGCPYFYFRFGLVDH